MRAIRVPIIQRLLRLFQEGADHPEVGEGGVQPLDGSKLVEKLETASGAYLQNHGADLRLTGDYDSASILLERVQ